MDWRSSSVPMNVNLKDTSLLMITGWVAPLSPPPPPLLLLYFLFLFLFLLFFSSSSSFLPLVSRRWQLLISSTVYCFLLLYVSFLVFFISFSISYILRESLHLGAVSSCLSFSIFCFILVCLFWALFLVHFFSSLIFFFSSSFLTYFPLPHTHLAFFFLPPFFPSRPSTPRFSSGKEREANTNILVWGRFQSKGRENH